MSELPDAGLGIHRRGRGRELEQVQRRSRIAVGKAGDCRQRLVGDVDRRRPEPALLVGQRPPQDAFDGLGRKRLQHEHLRARQERGVDLERRILRRRTDQDDVAGFDARKKRVLLRLVEAVDLVHEHDRPAAHSSPALLRRGHDLLDLLDAGEHGAERHEVRLRDLGDHSRERRLARAGRTPEDDRLQEVAFDGLAQRPARREDLFLTDDLVERAWTDPFRERRAGGGRRCPRRV